MLQLKTRTAEMTRFQELLSELQREEGPEGAQSTRMFFAHLESSAFPYTGSW